MMDESAWFGMDPSEDKDDLDEWSLVFDVVSQPDRIQNSVSVSRQPSCKSAPLPAPAYRHDLSVFRVHSRASSSCQFGGLAPPSQPQPRFESRIEPSAGLPSPDVQHSVPRSLQLHHEMSDVINLDASVDSALQPVKARKLSGHTGVASFSSHKGSSSIEFPISHVIVAFRGFIVCCFFTAVAAVAIECISHPAL